MRKFQQKHAHNRVVHILCQPIFKEISVRSEVPDLNPDAGYEQMCWFSIIVNLF